MNKGRYLLIILLIFFILILATCGSFLFFELGRPPAVKSNSYLELNLSGAIHEKASPDFFTSFLGLRPPLSLFDIWLNLQKAMRDSRIKGVIIRIGYLECDWGKVSELRECIQEFKKSGKKVYAYIEESVDFDKEYYLATACDKIILHPLGMFIINGIGGDIPFLKNTLDKIGIEAEVEHVEEYKTAYNMFTEVEFTESHKEMIESIYGDIYSQYIKISADARGKSEEEFRKLIDHAYYQGEKALEAGLVDEILYEDELIDKFSENDTNLYKITNEQYTRIKPASVGLYKGRKIALIYGTGPILSGEGAYQVMGSATTARWLRKARQDRSISAVVFRVDSPGGSPVASDVIWREIELTKKEKPVIISMSDMAGSGGYWIAMGAHKIVAQPQTLTGSIGVIFGKFNMVKLFEKIGITSEKISFGEKSDMFSPFRRLTKDEREFLKQEILWTYDRFLSKVAAGRNLSKEKVDEIGRGRVWTGNQAKEIGLIDEIGGLTRAVELAKELAGIPPYEKVKFVVWPKKISFFDMLFNKPMIKSKIGFGHRLEKIAETFSLLKKEGIWALMPFWIAVD